MNKLNHSTGVSYLMENRPGWSYFPILSLIWTKGFAFGVACGMMWAHETENTDGE